MRYVLAVLLVLLCVPPAAAAEPLPIRATTRGPELVVVEWPPVAGADLACAVRVTRPPVETVACGATPDAVVTGSYLIPGDVVRVRVFDAGGATLAEGVGVVEARVYLPLVH